MDDIDMSKSGDIVLFTAKCHTADFIQLVLSLYVNLFRKHHMKTRLINYHNK